MVRLDVRKYSSGHTDYTSCQETRATGQPKKQIKSKKPLVLICHQEIKPIKELFTEETAGKVAAAAHSRVTKKSSKS